MMDNPADSIPEEVLPLYYAQGMLNCAVDNIAAVSLDGLHDFLLLSVSEASGNTHAALAFRELNRYVQKKTMYMTAHEKHMFMGRTRLRDIASDSWEHSGDLLTYLGTYLVTLADPVRKEFVFGGEKEKRRKEDGGRNS